MFYHFLDMEQDMLPEHCEYEDDGCDLFSSCLHCPLTRCRYDEPKRQMSKELRNKEIRRLHKDGLKVEKLAQRFGVSKRTIHRVIASTTCKEF